MAVKAAVHVVQTHAGKVRGKRSVSVLGDKYVYAFQGIPYAKPPLGELRFRKPEPPENWTETVRCATQTPEQCMQFNVRSPRNLLWLPYDQGKCEDCLYLNVWAPELNPSAPLPVMVWIHGGGFTEGSATPEDYGPVLAAFGNVVVVSFNYRLGAFGFLCAESEQDGAPGNAGLHDQVLALKWIQLNIAAGGNPGEVTLFGWSAGAASTGFHLISPGSQTLFQRAIVQSTYKSWSLTRQRNWVEKIASSIKFAGNGGCSGAGRDLRANKSEDIVACQRTLNADLDVAVDAFFPGFGPGVFPPLTGQEMIPKEPSLAADLPGFTDKDVMIGQTAYEGSNLLYQTFRDQFEELPPRLILKNEPINFKGSLEKLIIFDAKKLQREYPGSSGSMDNRWKSLF
uniref:Esterase n=1 Tax=Rhipicephalus microplus TaxID=6941 RepID=A4L843_RHIMP|nr:esterase [Rhipicephalus microplus]